jgi:alkylation response protein AidB-like acyl-CoA dehydrogenase
MFDDIDDMDEFRSRLRTWLGKTLPEGWAEKMAQSPLDEMIAFQRWWMDERRKVGLATPHWPKEFGGQAYGLAHELVMAEEFARAGAPSVGAFIVSVIHVPATLLVWGTEEQKRLYLPGVAKGEIWCQGFSEPNAGSDLASLRTHAVRDGSDFVINGQKIWSSYSPYADYCILLARTDPNATKHKGITFFVMNMKAKGVVVRPIRQAPGRAEFGEIFLQNVRIPQTDIVGPENEGWKVCHTTLAAERGVYAFEAVERQRYAFEQFLDRSQKSQANWLQDSQHCREFMHLFTEMQGNRRLVRQLLVELASPLNNGSVIASIVKLLTTTHRRRFADFCVRTREVEGQLYKPGLEDHIDESMFEYLHSLGGTIAGGTSEIMKNIISERGLGLPR